LADVELCDHIMSATPGSPYRYITD